MRTRIKVDLLAATNAQQVLCFFVDHPNEEMLAADVQAATKLSKAGIYRALDVLARQGMVEKLKKGRFAFYRIVTDDCFVRQYKVLKTVSFLRPLVKKLKDVSTEIVLYGSASRGEDYSDSDIDLFIIASEPHEARKALSGVKLKRKLQGVIKTITEVADMEANNPEYLGEVNAGIVLWRQKDDA